MMRFLLIILVLLASQVLAQSENQRELDASIKNVTVFLKGAQVTREGRSIIKKGRSVLTVKSLSPHLDAKSIQVKGIGDFTILSVNHDYNFLDELNLDHKVDSLIEITKELEKKIDIGNSRISVLNEKQSLLHANKKLGNELASATINELKQAVDFYDKTLMEIKNEELQLKDKISDDKALLARIRKELKEMHDYEGKPTSEINIHVEADMNTNAAFTINYMVANAGWFPKYDLRVKDVESPLELRYKANVYQNTGVDWNDVKLTFSNGNPNQSGVAPALTTWHLNYERNTVYRNAVAYNDVEIGSVRSVAGRVISTEDGPLPGVNVVVKGTTVGTVTDVEGYYSLTLPNNASTLVFSSVGFISEELAITSSQMDVNMMADVTQLEEIVVTGYGVSGRASGYSSPSRSSYRKPKVAKTVITTKIENQTTVEFEVKTPYTLQSNGESLSVNLKKHEIETLYEYYAVPKLDKDAFLIARIINWDQFDLLEGEANLYFEDAYVGRSILNAKALDDTLDISLGRDKSIVIGRERVDTFTKRKAIASNKIETRGFNLIARNKKSQPIHLTLYDQIPVAAINTIEVAPKELSEGALNEQSGEVKWVLNLEPQSQVDLELKYEVKYPKRERVVLE